MELEIIYEEVIMDYMYMYVVIPLCVTGVVLDKYILVLWKYSTVRDINISLILVKWII